MFEPGSLLAFLLLLAAAPRDTQGEAGASLSRWRAVHEWGMRNDVSMRGADVGTANASDAAYPLAPMDGRRAFGVYASATRPARRGEAYARVPWSLAVCAREGHSPEARAPDSSIARALKTLRTAVAKAHADKGREVAWEAYDVAFGAVQLLALRFGAGEDGPEFFLVDEFAIGQAVDHAALEAQLPLRYPSHERQLPSLLFQRG